MTLDEFRATRQDVADLEQHLDIAMSETGIPCPGYVYHGKYWIERRNPNWGTQCRGQYYLILGAEDCLDDDLAAMEERLYLYACGEEDWPRPIRYAVVQHGVAVFGLGSTEEQAITDARGWCAVDNAAIPDELPSRPANLYDFYIARCTPALAQAVADFGGDIAFARTTDGTVCLPEEE